MALDSREDFFGCKLSKDNKEHVWSAPEDTELDIEHKLQITQACLGVDAKQGERNVVDVTTEDESGAQVTHTILSLRLGQIDMARVELGLLNKSTFKLVHGNGPVHLTGLHMQAAFGGEDSDEDDDESDEDAPCCVKIADNKVCVKTADNKEEVKNVKAAVKEQKPAVKDAKQAKPEEPKKPVAKPHPVTKAAKAEEDSEGSDEDDDEDDDEEEEAKGNKLIDDEASDDDEEMDSEDEDESDDDLDDEDDDDSDDDDEDDDLDVSDVDDSEDDEEEEIAPPKAKKSKIVMNGRGKDEKTKTPNKKADNTPAKTPDAKDKTPKSNKKGEIKTPKGAKTPATPNLEDVKKKLLKSPNLPKTAEKFKNFMKSAHRVTDDDTLKGLWDWVQKSKK